MIAETDMDIFSRILNSHGPPSIQNGRDRHMLIALLKSECPVCLLQPRDAYACSRQFTTQIQYGLQD